MATDWRGRSLRDALKPYEGNKNYYTPYSSAIDGMVNIDPSVRRIQDDILGRSNALYGEIGETTRETVGSLRGLRGRYTGNEAGYTQAMVNPVLRARASALGALNRQHGLRRVTGSSFANQDIVGAETDFAREEADARAMAERANIEGLRGLEGDIMGQTLASAGARGEINQQDFAISQARFAQELAALGLGQQQIQQAMDAFENYAKRGMARRQSIASTIGSTAGKKTTTATPNPSSGIG